VLTEILTALAIFVVLSAMVINVHLMSVRTWRQGSAQVSLQRQLGAALHRMVQGERGGAENRQHGLREARSVAVVDPHTINFTSDVDDTTRRFYLKGNELVYLPNVGDTDEKTIYDPSYSEGPYETSTHRTDVQFNQLADGTVEIRLVGQRRVRDRWITAALVTRVAPRNLD
jgi:type II secretory pathway pseudopilin PulG